MRRAIARAKMGYWQEQIDGARTDRDLYRIAGWRNATTKVTPPKLTDQPGLDDKETVQEIAKRLPGKRPQKTPTKMKREEKRPYGDGSPFQRKRFAKDV